MSDRSPSRNPATRAGGYDPGHYEHLVAVEDEHFWFAGRAKAIEEVVRPLVAELAPGYRVLEIGCGTGHVLHMLERICGKGRLVGMDLFHEGLLHARRRCSCSLLQASSAAPPFSTRFDLVGMFDVLEHLQEDRRFLESAHRLLTPQGALLVTVPAHQSLWSAFDERSDHCRRYEAPDLDRLLNAAGYHVEYLTQFMASIFPLVWASRRLARWNANADPVQSELRIRPVLNSTLRWLLEHEARVFVQRRRQLPIGTSLLALARPRVA